MDEASCSIHAADRQCDDAPFGDERNRYLRHCANHGAAPAALKIKRNELLWIAGGSTRMPAKASAWKCFWRIALERQSLHGAVTAARRVVDIGRPWLRFLGWWREPTAVFQHQDQLDRYVAWMRDERGFTPSTVEQWGRKAGRFLRWCEQSNRQLSALRPETSTTISRPRQRADGPASRWPIRRRPCEDFCVTRQREGIARIAWRRRFARPRLYQQESLPYAPDWSDVQRMLADADTDKPRDIRDRAILLLLAIYGMRSGEVAALRLDQIDWPGRTASAISSEASTAPGLSVAPLRRRGLARYIDTVRPASSCPEVFLCMQAPRRPMKAGSIYDVANRRFVALGIEAAHRGGHALRHACATRLLADGLSLKEIGDHLGHRSTSATSIYAKVNMAALREVGAFDLGDLQ